MLSKQGYKLSYEEIDALFDYKQNMSNKIHTEVQ